MNCGVLAVWGSPGSGKTVTAAQIARYLAEEKKVPVVLLLCDMTAPMLPCICPPSALTRERSLGSVFVGRQITTDLMDYNLSRYERLPHLSLLGLRKGENEYTFPACTKQQAEELLTGLRELFPYVVDCSSGIANDILSAVALLEADKVLRLAACDLKSVSYLSSQMPLLREVRWDEGKQRKVLVHTRAARSANRLENADFQLPYSKEVEERYLAGDLLSELTRKDSRTFREEIARICKEVFGC